MVVGLVLTVVFFFGNLASPYLILGFLLMIGGLVTFLVGRGVANRRANPRADDALRTVRNDAWNPFAIVAFVLAVTGGGSILGIVFGRIARSRLKREGGRGDGLALAALIISYIALAAIIGFVVWFVVVLNSAR